MFQKLHFNSVITTILVLVDDNSCLVIADSDKSEKSMLLRKPVGETAITSWPLREIAYGSFLLMFGG